ncbi:MAG TPA: hypothetical protein VMB72_03825 [Acidimicrobiales bacterium]|nr:hypothetical protein [Acidimicrobiales bacterium]
MIPRWLQGGWRREGRARGGEPMVEHSDVLWLQTSSYFADLRVPSVPAGAQLDELDVARAFSGVGSFDPPRFTWTHDIDTVPWGGPDVAELDGQSAVLLERGPGYVERWRREEPAADGAVLEWYRRSRLRRRGAPSARLVVVGHLAVGVWHRPVPAAAAFVQRARGWSTTAVLGEVPQRLELLHAMLGGLDRHEDLPAGWIRRDVDGSEEQGEP